MKMKENTKSKRNGERGALDIFVVLICLGGAFFGIYMFWQDLNKTLTKISETPIGTISYKYNGVQRRFSDRFMWSQLQTESPVYNGDIVRTAELSDATVTFQDETSIDLAENCLIQIFYGAEGARLELSSGTITVNAKSGMAIVSGGTELFLNAGAVVTTGAAGGELDIRVTSGTVTLNSGDLSSGGLSPPGGLLQTIEAGTSVSVTADGRVETPPRVIVLSPLPDAEIPGAENNARQIPFSWEKSHFSSNEEVRLEIATGRHFIQLTKSLDTPEDGTAVSLPPGTWWWRAYPRSQAEGHGAAIGKLTVIPPPATEPPAAPAVVETPAVRQTPAAPRPPAATPAPLPPLAAPGNMRPAAGFTIGAAEARRSRSITFFWDAVTGANAYDFKLYRERVGGTPVLTIRNTGTSYTINDISTLDNGNCLWQVEALNISGTPRRGRSAESRFVIDIPPPAQPRLGVSGAIYDDETN
jgi:hypothetical protein